MSLSTALFARLTTDAAVSGLVGDRIYPEIAPQQEKRYPRIVYELDNREDVECYQGFTSNLSSQRATLACIARTHPECKQLAEAVIAAIDDQSGTWGGIGVLTASKEDEREDVETGVAGQDFQLWIREIDVVVWFRPG